MPRDWRDERIAELEAENRQLRALVAELRRRLGNLEARLGQSSSNSNQAPSRDTPDQRRERKKKVATGRHQGAQRGHEPPVRPLVSEDKVSRIEDHFPSECELCGTPLPPVEELEPQRHQVIDLPEMVPDVTEHRRHAVDCPECGHRTRAR